MTRANNLAEIKLSKNTIRMCSWRVDLVGDRPILVHGLFGEDDSRIAQ